MFLEHNADDIIALIIGFVRQVERLDVRFATWFVMQVTGGVNALFDR